MCNKKCCYCFEKWRAWESTLCGTGKGEGMENEGLKVDITGGAKERGGGKDKCKQI